MFRRVVAIALSLALIQAVFLSCITLSRDDSRPPYGLLTADSAEGSGGALDGTYTYLFVNESNLVVTHITLAWEGYSGEESVSGEESYSVIVEAGGSCTCAISPDIYAGFTTEAVTVETVRATLIRYSDGSFWSDPFGRYEGNYMIEQ